MIVLIKIKFIVNFNTENLKQNGKKVEEQEVIDNEGYQVMQAQCHHFDEETELFVNSYEMNDLQYCKYREQKLYENFFVERLVLSSFCDVNTVLYVENPE